MRKTLYAIAGLMASLLLTGPVGATSTQVNPNIVRGVEAYFNKMTTYKANFEQVDSTQPFPQTGVFFLQRPRQFVWRYMAPQPQQIISTGSRLFYVDETTEQVTQLPLNVGLAALFTEEKLDFAQEDIRVISAYEKDNTWRVTLEVDEKMGLLPGTVALTFALEPTLHMVGLETSTGLGQTSTVRFENVEEGMAFAKELFRYTPPNEDTRFAN